MGVKEIIGIVVIVLAIVAYFVVDKIAKKEANENESDGNHTDDEYYDDDEYEDEDEYDDDEYEDEYEDEFDDIVVEDENKEKEQPKEILSLDESFQSLIKTVWLEKKLLSMDKFYKIKLQVDDEVLEEQAINSTFLVEVLGRFLYGGEARIEKLSETEVASPSHLPFDGNRDRFIKDNVVYIPPCTKINKDIYTNSLFTTYLKTDNLVQHLQKELAKGIRIVDFLPNNHTVLDKKEKKKAVTLPRLDVMALSQIMETVFLEESERVGKVSNELLENIYSIFDVEFDENLQLVIEDISMDEVGQSKKIISYSIDRWYGIYVREVGNAKLVRDGFFQVEEIISSKQKSKTNEEYDIVESLLGEGVLDKSQKEIAKHMATKLQQSLSVLPHFRERLCLASQFPQYSKELKLLDTLPKVGNI